MHPAGIVKSEPGGQFDQGGVGQGDRVDEVEQTRAAVHANAGSFQRAGGGCAPQEVVVSRTGRSKCPRCMVFCHAAPPSVDWPLASAL